jgi:hypothetical protein
MDIGHFSLPSPYLTDYADSTMPLFRILEPQDASGMVGQVEGCQSIREPSSRQRGALEMPRGTKTGKRSASFKTERS